MTIDQKHHEIDRAYVVVNGHRRLVRRCACGWQTVGRSHDLRDAELANHLDPNVYGSLRAPGEEIR